MLRTYLATAPELYLPAVAALVAAAFWRSVWLAAIAVVVLATGAWLFRGAAPAASAPLAIIAPAEGRVVLLDCLRPLGYGRIVVRAEGALGGLTAPYGRVAPMDGVLTAIEGATVYQLDTDVGRWTLMFRAPGDGSRVVRVAPDGPIRRGETIAVVKWGGAGGAAETVIEYPLRNVKIMPSVALGATVRLGAPMAEIQAVWS